MVSILTYCMSSFMRSLSTESNVALSASSCTPPKLGQSRQLALPHAHHLFSHHWSACTSDICRGRRGVPFLPPHWMTRRRLSSSSCWRRWRRRLGGPRSLRRRRLLRREAPSPVIRRREHQRQQWMSQLIIGIMSVQLFWTSVVKVGIFSFLAIRTMLNPDRMRLLV